MFFGKTLDSYSAFLQPDAYIIGGSIVGIVSKETDAASVGIETIN